MVAAQPADAGLASDSDTALAQPPAKPEPAPAAPAPVDNPFKRTRPEGAGSAATRPAQSQAHDGARVPWSLQVWLGIVP